MKKVSLEWYAYNNHCIDEAEMGTREEVKKIYKEYPAEYRAFEGEGIVRDRINHKNIKVYVCSVPSEDMGTRLLVYPMANQN